VGAPIGNVRSTRLLTSSTFRYLSDALTPSAAADILQSGVCPGRAARAEALVTHGYPAYTTDPAGSGYSDEKLARWLPRAVSDGFGQIKLKVGGDLSDDLRRLKIARDTVGPGVRIAVDANQRWDVATAIEWIRQLHHTSRHGRGTHLPDDVLGHAAIRKNIAPLKVATGDMCRTALSSSNCYRPALLTSCRSMPPAWAGSTRNIAILLLAATVRRPGMPACGRGGFVRAVQHLSMFDFVAVSDPSMTE